MRKRIVAVAALAALVLAGGLWVWSAPGPGGAQPVPVDQTIDDIFAQMARDVPGFGGMFFEGETLTVFLKDPSPERTAAVERALAAFFAGDGRFQAGKMQILSAQYDFSQLKEWYDRMRPVVPSVPGVVFTDIDDAKNRIRIGVETPEAQRLIEQRLAELGIPREVVNIEISEPRVLESSLRNRHRPLVAGLQIIGDYTGGGNCTLGFNARRAGVEGFVTASHCSELTAGLDGTGFHQPSSYNLAGVETADPSPFPPGTGDCPSGGLPCRYSDADFVTLAGGVSSSRGKIARPALNSYAWNGTSVSRISSSIPNAMVGETVMKVGRTTGRTQGTITGLCINGSYNGVQWLCRNSANFSAALGDSGGTVFRITNSPSVNDVQLYGIVVSITGGPPCTTPL